MPRNFNTTTQRPVCSLHLRSAFFCQLSGDFREFGFTFPRYDYIIQYVGKDPGSQGTLEFSVSKIVTKKGIKASQSIKLWIRHLRLDFTGNIK